MLTYIAQQLTTVSKDSWHYRLNHYALGSAADNIKRACPYWLVLVFVSSVFGTVRLTATTLYNTALYIGYYPWIVLGWTFGFKPRYWQGLTQSVGDGKKSVFYKSERSYRTYDRRGYMPWLLMPFAAMAPISVYVFGVGRTRIDVVTALNWYYIVVIAYGLLLALIVLGNAWRYGSWPLVVKTSRAIQRGYFTVCPELKVVESAPSRSQAEPTD